MFRRVLFCALVLLSVAWSLQAQSITGTILGTVKDSSGAVVPGASITLTNEETGVATSAVSDERGDFGIPNVGPGSYTVKAEMSGFKPALVKSVRLLATRSVRIEPVLEPGTVAQEVQVVASAPVVNS